MFSVRSGSLAVITVTLAWAVHRGPDAEPSVRPIGRIVATSNEMLANIGDIRVLSDGHVMVNDRVGHRVVLFDSTLATFVAVADTTSETAKAYGKQPGGLLPYRNDTSIFADPASLSFLVISPAGKIARTIAAPLGPGGGLGYLTSPIYNATMDPHGNIVYRFAWAARALIPRLSALPPQPVGSSVSLMAPDSALLLRANALTKQRDTAASIAMAGTLLSVTSGPGPYDFSGKQIRSPLVISDVWTLLSDGTIAIVRVSDYHVDWISPDGARSSSPKISHEWVRITDSAKTAIVDSATRADSIRLELAMAAAAREDAFSGGRGGAGGGGGAGGRGGVVAGVAVEGRGVAVARGAASGSGPSVSLSITSSGFDASALPDYWPPFVTANDSTGSGQVRADADDNLWIRVYQLHPLAGGPVFEVVNRKGVLVDRVQIPGGTTIVGFGPGVAYLTSRDGAGYRLAKARIH